MKIVIEAQRLFRSKKHGMEIVALETIKELQKIDEHNHYTILVRKDQDHLCIQKTRNFNIRQLSARSFPTWEQITLPAFLKKAKPDLLHCTANTAPLFVSTPMVVTIHDVIYMESMNFSGSSYQNFGNMYRKLIVPKIARKAKLIITVSSYEKKVIAKALNIPENKIRVVHNGLHARFKVINDATAFEVIREKYQLPSKFILHIGNTAPRKNTAGVLQSYYIYQQNNEETLPLLITGCGKAFILNLLKRHSLTGLEDKIKVLDYLPIEEIPLLYNMANLFLYPSFREGFGMPVIESMACGTPVITSDNSSLPEISNNAACLINPEDHQQMAGSIAEITKNNDLYKNYVDKGLENAKRFTWKRAAENTLGIYKELTA